MNKREIIEKNLRNSIDLKNRVLSDEDILNKIESVATALIKGYKDSKKVLFCGNGGSAADSQHLAAELSGRYYFDRAPLNAEALHVNSSYLTAVANDYSFDMIYSRLVEGVGVGGDILIGLSTSGNSRNVILALEAAKRKGMVTVGLTGETAGEMASYCDHLITIPSSDTPRIQECHLMIGHAICEIVEAVMFPN